MRPYGSVIPKNLFSITRSLRATVAAIVVLACTTEVSANPMDASWNQPGGGNWSAASNWSSTVPGYPGGIFDIARFLNSISADSTVTLDTPILLNQIYFNSPFSYTLTGSASNPLTFTGTTPTITVSGNQTISALIAGTAGLSVAGPGILNITGNQVNTLTGGIWINSGATLRFGTSTAMFGSNVYTLDGGTLSLAFNGVSLSNSRTIVLNGAGATNRIESFSNNYDIINGTISGPGGFSKVGPGSLTLSLSLITSSNTFAGPVVIGGGTLRLAGASASVIPTTANVTMNPGTAIDISTSVAGGTANIASISMADGMIFSTYLASSNSILNASAWTLQNGYIAASLGGPNGITKVGVGTITAVANNFGSNYAQTSTAILGGAYYLPTASSTPLGSTALVNTTTINGGALVFGSFSAGTLSANRLFVFGTSLTNVIDSGTTGTTTIPSVVTGLVVDGGFHKAGTGTLSFTGADTYTGNTTIWGGDFRAPLGLLPGLPDLSALVLRGGTFTGNATAGTTAFTRSLGTAIGSVSWAPNADGGFAAFGGNMNVNINGNLFTPDTLTWGSTANFIQSGRALILGSSTASGAVSILNPIDLNGSTRTIIVPLGTGADTATLTGGLLNSGGTVAGLVKAGGSPLIFTATPTYDGTTTIAAGAVQFVSGALPTGNITLAGGVLQLNNATPQNFTLSLGSGSGQIRWTGSGGFAAIGGVALAVNINGNTTTPDTLVWGSTPNFVAAGNTLIFGSTTGITGVTFSNPINLNAATRTIAVLGGTTTVTLTNGSLTKTGAGILSLNTGTSLDSTGTLTVAAGALSANSVALSVANADIAGTLSGTGTVSVSTSIILRDLASITNPFTGAAGLTKIGAGSSTLTAANTYSGPTEIDGAGRLLINGGGILNSTSITINGSLPLNCGSTTGALYPSLGGSLVIIGTNGQDRLKTPATGNGTLPLTINGGFLSIAGISSGTTTITQNFAALTLGNGAAGLFLSPNSGVAGQTITFNFNPASANGLNSSAGSTLVIGGPSLGTTTRVTFSGTLPLSGTGSVSGAGSGITLGVLRGVFGDVGSTVTTGSTNQFTFAAAGAGMVTYDANGVRLLAAGEYQTAGPGTVTGFVPTANANIKISAGTASLVDGTSTTINSLMMSSSGTVGAILNLASTTATNTLTITSGNVLFTGGNNSIAAAIPSIGNGVTGGSLTLDFGGTQANFVVGNGTSASTTSPAQLRAILSAKVTGSAGFVKSGPGILTWTTLNGSSTLTGGSFYLNGGILAVSDIANTIGTSLSLNFSGGTLQFTGTAANPASVVATRTGSVIINAAGGTFDTQIGGGSAGGGISFASMQMPNAAVVFSGVVSGIGSLTKTGIGGGLVLQNDNTYSGGTILNGGYLVIPTVDSTGSTLLTSQLGNNSAGNNILTLTTGTLMPAGFNAVVGGDCLTISLPVNLGGESTFGYIGPPGASPGFTPFAPINAIPARLTLSGPMTITTGLSHVFTNNNPANVGGFSLILSGNIGETTSGSNLLFTGIGNSMPPGGPQLYAPVMSVPAFLTNVSITGANTYTGQTTIRQGIVNPNASVIAGQKGPFGNSYLPIVIGDPGGGTFAGVLLNGNNLTIDRNIQLQIAGTGGAAPPAVAPIYLGTLPGSAAGTISGNIQLANRTLFLFSGGGTVAAPMVVSGVISDGGNILFGGLGVGPNTVTSFTAANSYSGGTGVFAGTLLVNNATGSGTGTGAVTIGPSGTLGGSGTIAGPITVSGTLTPGTAAATRQLTAGAVTFNTNSVFHATLFGTGPSQIGSLNANSVDGTAQFVLDLSNVDADSLRAAAGSTPRTYTIIQSNTPLTNFTPSGLTILGLGNFESSEWSISDPSSGATSLQLTFSPVPEPAAILLVGAIGLAAVRRFRRRKQ